MTRTIEPRKRRGKYLPVTMATQEFLALKPSELIRLAINDLVKIERSKRYAVDMSDWHVPVRKHDTCYVCLAGAVMAKEFAFPIDRRAAVGEYDGNYNWSYGRGNFNARVARRLSALDQFRQGNVYGGLKEGWSKQFAARNAFRLGRAGVTALEAALQTDADYDNDPEAFKATMRALAKALAKEGL